MDVGFAIICSLARHRRPQIQFLSIGSRVCSALLSDFASRLSPCASLSLRLHQAVQRTFTSKLSNMLSTHENGTDIAVCPENSVELTLGGDGLMGEQMRGDFAEVPDDA